MLGVPNGERLNWVVWEEGKSPDVVIKLLSKSTAEADKQEQKLIYQNQMCVSDHFWFNPFNPDDWAGFSLQQGEISTDSAECPRSIFVSQFLKLVLTRLQGTYKLQRYYNGLGSFGKSGWNTSAYG